MHTLNMKKEKVTPNLSNAPGLANVLDMPTMSGLSGGPDLVVQQITSSMNGDMDANLLAHSRFPGKASPEEKLFSHEPTLNMGRFYAREGVDPLTEAFPKKIAVHPGVGGEPVNKEEYASLWNTLSTHSISEKTLENKVPADKTVAYIHVPFCETHCLYCGFYRIGYKKEHSRAYVDSLIRELTFWHKDASGGQSPVHAVYLGGGTPTALEPEDLARLIRALRQYLPVANDCEITVEGRVSNLTRERIEAALSAGANRFSLGVQSFNTQVRQSVKRRSTREALLQKISLLQSYNQAAIVIDLIYGLPFQTLEVWLDDINTAHSLELDGVDCYQLNVYSSSPLAKAIDRGKLPAGATIVEQAKFFEAGVQAMEKAFYRRLSMSHWGRTPRERNIYNQYVKSTADCLAFGPGAGGTLRGHFYYNEPDYRQWQAGVAQGHKPIAMMMRPKPSAQLFRCITEHMEQLRLDVEALEREYALPLSQYLSPLLQQWERAGLVSPFGGGVVLSLAGQFWQVTLTQLLLNYLKEVLQES